MTGYAVLMGFLGGAWVGVVMLISGAGRRGQWRLGMALSGAALALAVLWGGLLHQVGYVHAANEGWFVVWLAVVSCGVYWGGRKVWWRV